jgi:hypothetical protein
VRVEVSKTKNPDVAEAEAQSLAPRYTILVIRGPDCDHAAGTQCGDTAAEAHEFRCVLRIVLFVRR